MNRDLSFLTVSLFLWGIGDGFFWFFQPLVLQNFGADPVLIGIITSGFAVVMGIAHIPAGILADRIGRRPLLWASWQIGLAAIIVMALSKTLAPFVAGYIVYGFSAAVMAPMNSYITAARGKLPVGRALTLVSSGYNLGAVIGPVAGGWIAGKYGLQSIFWFATGIILISNLTILFLRKQPVENSEPSHIRGGITIHPRYVGYLVIMFLTIFATYLPQPLSSNYLQNEKLLNYEQIGQLGSISSMGVVVLNLLLGQINAGAGFLLSQVAVAVFALLLWRGSGFPFFALGYFVMGGYRTAKALGTSFTRSLVPPSKMGLAYGLTETVCSLATILAPLLAGVLYSTHPESVYITGLGLIGISISAGLIFFTITRTSNVV